MAEPISFTWGLHVMLSLFDRGRIRSRKVNLCFWRHWANCFTLDVIRHYAVEVPRCFEHSQFFFRVINILNFAPQKMLFIFFLPWENIPGLNEFSRESQLTEITSEKKYWGLRDSNVRSNGNWARRCPDFWPGFLATAPLLSTAQLHTQMEEGMHRNISLKEVFRDRGYWMFNIGSPI